MSLRLLKPENRSILTPRRAQKLETSRRQGCRVDKPPCLLSGIGPGGLCSLGLSKQKLMLGL